MTAVALCDATVCRPSNESPVTFCHTKKASHFSVRHWYFFLYRSNFVGVNPHNVAKQFYPCKVRLLSTKQYFFQLKFEAILATSVAAGGFPAYLKKIHYHLDKLVCKKQVKSLNASFAEMWTARSIIQNA